MHPNRVFEYRDREAMLDFVAERAFAHIFSAANGSLAVAHAPVIVVDGKVQFHIARRNRGAGMAGRRVLVSMAGRDGFQSADWYVSADQVPTWHYEAVEIEGEARQLSDAELIAQVDRLSDVMERRVAPESPWTRAKMTPGKFEAMVKAIVGFEVDPAEIRGTFKFNQHKAPEDIAATIAGQRSAGREDIAAAVNEATNRP